MFYLVVSCCILCFVSYVSVLFLFAVGCCLWCVFCSVVLRLCLFYCVLCCIVLYGAFRIVCCVHCDVHIVWFLLCGCIVRFNMLFVLWLLVL